MRALLVALLALCLVSCKTLTYYSILTSVNPAGAGTVAISSAEMSVLEGTSVTFTATPKGDYVFSGWSGSLSGTTNPATIVATSDLNVVANFTLKTYPLDVTVEGEGTVNERILSSKAEYGSGSIIELTAQPADHWLFDHWEGDLTGKENPTQITVSSAKSVKAVFVKKMYDLTVTIEGDGAVSEKIVETKSGSYQEGPVVELTATPATGWSFDHWEGDLSGTENPSQITVSAAKSVKAIFTKNKYAYKLVTIGPGVVNEGFVETKCFEYNTVLCLKAVANEFEGATFAGWEGDASGKESKIIVTMDSDKTIVARFLYPEEARTTRPYPLVDLSRPSSELKRLYVDEDFSQFTFSAYQMLQLDYNRDGYLDVVTALFEGIGGLSESDRIPLGFYLGNPDGSFSSDEKNDGRIQGMLHIRKWVYGDYNSDGVPDIVLLGHGYDADPLPGEYPVILMSSPDGSYSDIRFKELDGGFYHGGASGDIDNDGDLDVFLIDNFGHVGFLMNNGDGGWTYTQDIVNKELYVSLFNTELYDIDKDGYLDLICGGHDWEDLSYWQDGDTSYSNCPIVFWGNGVSYKDGDRCRLPEATICGYGLVTDFTFYDLDQDGTEELIISRTGDGVQGGIEYYAGWAIQILKRDGRNFVDVTTYYLSLSDAHYKSTYCAEWLVKINIEQSADGHTYLCGVYDDKEHGPAEKLFEYKNKTLVPLYNKQKPIFDVNGACIYSDRFWGEDFWFEVTNVDFACTEQPYLGEKCIYWKAEEAWKQSFSFIAPKLNLSQCVVDGYELEFYVRYTNPDLELCLNLETTYTNPPHRGYGHSFKLPANEADGEWHRVHAPLSEFYNCDDCDNSGWGEIQLVMMWVISENTVGAEFYLDEMRIRKALPE